jgi:uncharacterized repeat protein (TIGR01451 family)
MVSPPSSLTVSSTHSGNFIQGQNGVYILTVFNQSGAAPAAGTVTVTEALPSGMTLRLRDGRLRMDLRQQHLHRHQYPATRRQLSHHHRLHRCSIGICEIELLCFADPLEARRNNIFNSAG